MKIEKFKIVRYFEHEEPSDEQTNHDFGKEGGMFEFKKIMNEQPRSRLPFARL